MPVTTDPEGRSTSKEDVLPDAEWLEMPGGGWTREQCWARVSPPVATRVLALSGPAITWSASAAASAAPRPGERVAGPGSVQAVVVGRRALVIAEPMHRRGADGPVPAHRVSTYTLDAATFLHAHVAHTPAQLVTAAPRQTPPPGTAAAPRPAVSGRALPGGLDDATARVIRSMPIAAQDPLVVPITASGDTLLRCHSFWQGSSERSLDFVLVVLASAHRVTFAYGARCIPPDAQPSTARWTLDCWHAEVIQRRGQ